MCFVTCSLLGLVAEYIWKKARDLRTFSDYSNENA